METQLNSKARLMIVDDDVLIAESNKFFLKRAGYNIVSVALNPHQAIADAKEKTPELILMDINLASDIDGIAAAEEIQKFADIPIIFLTAYSDPATFERAKKIGPFGYMIKPYDNKELLVTIETSINKHLFEKRIKEQELLFRTIANFAFEWEFWLLPDMQFKYCSPSCKRITGFESEEFMKNPKLLLEIVHPDDRKKYSQFVEEFSKPHKYNETVKDFQFRIIDKEGSVKHLSHSCISIFDDKNNYLGRRITNIDITERKRAEESLRDSEKNYREIFNSTSEAIFIHDADTFQIVDVNDSMLSMYGYDSKEDYLSNPDNTFSVPDPLYNKETAFEKLRNTIEEGPQSFEWLAFKKNGEPFWAEVSLKLTEIGGKRKILAVVRNTDDKKKALESVNAVNERWQSLFNNSPDAIAVYKAVDEGKDFIFTDFNMTAQKTENLSRDLVIGKRISELFPGAEGLGFLEIFRKVWQTGETEYIKASYYKDSRIEGWRENIIYKLSTNEIVAIYNDVTEKMTVEIKIRQSEQKFRSLFENAPDPIILLTLDGNIVDANPAASKILGYESSELKNMKMLDLNTEEFKPKVNERLATLHKEGKLFFGTSHYSKQGTILHFEINSTLLEFEGEKRILSVYRDITARMKTEAELRESQEHFRLIYNLSPHAIAITEIETGRFVEINEAYQNILSYRRDEIIGKTSLELNIWINPNDRILLTEPLRRGELVNNIELDFRTKDNRVIDCLVSVRIIQINNRSYMLSIVNDITKLREAERKINESQEIFRSVVETANEGIWMLDENNITTFVNPALEQMLGYPAAEMMGKSIKDFLVGEDLKDFYNRLAQRKEGKREILERRYHHKNGSIIYASVSASPIFDKEKKYIGTFAMITDITEIRRFHEALRLNAEQFELLTSTSLDGYWKVDLHGNIIDVNEAYCRMTGYGKDEILNMRIMDLEANEKAEETERRIEKLLNDKYDKFETKHRCKDGMIIEVEVSTVHAKNLGVILAFINDITERKKYEAELIHQMEEINRFNKLMIGREEKMVQLKEEINHLLSELGRPKKYEQKENNI